MTATIAASGSSTLAEPVAALVLGAERVGGKAHSLAALTAAGEQVPEWLVVTADVLDAHLRTAGMDTLVHRELRALEAEEPARGEAARVATALQAIVGALPLDVELSDALVEAASRIGAPLAVRSSAVGEDGERHSFAGQFDTLLDVEVESVGDALRQCWRSAFSVRALEYRRRTGTLRDATRLAVIVQRQVTGDVSGVLFTIDPLSGAADRMHVSACRGLGESLVSGEVDGDEYLITPEGVELGASRVAAEHRLLDPTMLRQLAALGERLSQGRGPRDVEWTVRDGQLWVLQDRPVTTPAAPAAAHRIVWDNSNIQESYCGVTTPLTFSFARDAYASVYEQTMRAVGISERVIAEHRPTLRTLLGLLHGRVYYNLDSWYRGLLLLPAFRRNKEDMERMMGVEEPVDFVADEDDTFMQRTRRLPRLAGTLVRLIAAFATLDRDAQRFLANFEGRLRALDRASLQGRPLAELMTLLEQLRTECLERWTTPIINDFHVMMSAGRLRRMVRRGLGDAPDGDVDLAMQTLLGGAAVAVSAAPATLMLELAEIARREPAVAHALEHGDANEALSRARAASPEFAARLDELLDRYGDRCMGELKLESRSLRDDAAFVVRMLRNYLGAPRDSRAPAAAEASRVRRELESRVAARLGVIARWRFRRTLGAARAAIARRETLRLARTRLFGVHRDIYRAIGSRLHEHGRLNDRDDVFYLSTDEIRAEWEGTGIGADLAALVRARRAEFAGYERVSPPNRIVTTGVPNETLPLATARVVVESGRLLRGLGCSAGVVEGPVRIVRAPSDDLAIDGHILVAPRTDPGWAPLFPSARAIIVERGSLLSHSAVLARELGLPAVVGFPGILETLRDGERVRVDGAAGTIERLELPCES